MIVDAAVGEPSRTLVPRDARALMRDLEATPGADGPFPVDGPRDGGRHDMRKREFSIVHLVVLLTLITVAAVVAIARIVTTRRELNEIAAVAALREIAAAQAKFRGARHVDIDRDGQGEFGFLKELSGASGVRARADGGRVGTVVSPPLLPAEFRMVGTTGELRLSGYLFRVFLPGESGLAVGESQLFPVAEAVDARLASRAWCCYAWPSNHGTAGDRTFFVDATGVVLETDCALYSGEGAFSADAAGAALRRGPATNDVTGVAAVDAIGRDGRTWRRAD
jgi:hypothetical protein